MKVKIVTPQEKLFEDEAMQVVLPGEDGELSIWDFHQPCLYPLRSGQIILKFRKTKPAKEEKTFAITSGIARVESDKLILMVEHA